MNEPKIATSDMCDADYDAEVRFAGAGVLRIDDGVDREYVYPPAKWESTHRAPPAGAPYEVKPVVSWPAEVDARLTSLEAVQNLDGERLKRVEVMAEQLLALFMEHRLEYERNREDERK